MEFSEEPRQLAEQPSEPSEGRKKREMDVELYIRGPPFERSSTRDVIPLQHSQTKRFPADMVPGLPDWPRPCARDKPPRTCASLAGLRPRSFRAGLRGSKAPPTRRRGGVSRSCSNSGDSGGICCNRILRISIP